MPSFRSVVRAFPLALGLTAVPPPALARIRLPGEPGADAKPPVEAPDETRAAVSARYGDFGALVFGPGVGAAWRTNGWELGVGAAEGRADLTQAVGSQLTTDQALAGRQVDSLKLAATLVQAEVRAFLPRGFTVTGGLGWRQLQGHVALGDPTGQELTTDARITSLVATVAAGSVWEFDGGFFAGVDWIGVAVPLTSSWSTTSQGPDAPRAALEAQADALAGQLARAPAVILLVGSVGWRF